MTEAQIFAEIEKIGGVRKVYKSTRELQKLYGGTKKFSVLSDALQYCGDPCHIYHLSYKEAQEQGHKRFVLKDGLIDYFASSWYSASHATFYAPPLVEVLDEVVGFLKSLGDNYGDYIGWSSWDNGKGAYTHNRDKLPKEDWFKKKKYCLEGVLNILKSHDLVIEKELD